MANPLQNSNQKTPLTIADLDDDQNYLPIPEDTLQLQVDTLNVCEKRVALSSFSEEYQQKIINYYRFSCDRQNTDNPKIAKRTTDTFDLI